MITLLVEQITSDSFITPTIPSDKGGWLKGNKTILSYWATKSHFEIVDVTSFNPDVHKNPYYLIVPDHFHQTIGARKFWDRLPKDTIDILRIHAIPILIAHPLELSYGVYTSNLDIFMQEKAQAGLWTNEVVILSLTSYYHYLTGDAIPIDELGLGLEKLSWVSSLGFLDFWKANGLLNVMQNESKFVEISEHIPENKTKLALCLNGISRQSRQLLTQALHSHQFDNILTSQRFDISRRELIETISCIPNKDPDTKILLDQILLDSEHNPSPRKTLEGDRDFGLEGSWNKKWYENTWCSIISETHTNDLRNHLTSCSIESPLITEKTIKAILNHHPFTIYGHSYSTRMLNDLGFRTFDDTWFNLPDDTYTTLPQRLTRLIHCLHALSKLSHEELTDKWNNIVPDLIYNRNHLLNTDWSEIQANMLANRCASES